MIAAENPLSLSLLLPPLIPNSTLTTPPRPPLSTNPTLTATNPIKLGSYEFYGGGLIQR